VLAPVQLLTYQPHSTWLIINLAKTIWPQMTVELNVVQRIRSGNGNAQMRVEMPPPVAIKLIKSNEICI